MNFILPENIEQTGITPQNYLNIEITNQTPLVFDTISIAKFELEDIHLDMRTRLDHIGPDQLHLNNLDFDIIAEDVTLYNLRLNSDRNGMFIVKAEKLEYITSYIVLIVLDVHLGADINKLTFNMPLKGFKGQGR